MFELYDLNELLKLIEFLMIKKDLVFFLGIILEILSRKLVYLEDLGMIY